VSHRGDTRSHVENSLAAFRAALATGADGVELDVHLTADGGLAVLHDATLDRTAAGRGPVAERAWADVGACPLRGAPDERVPSLDEALAVLAPADVRVFIEIKTAADGRPYPGIEERVLAAVARAGVTGRTTITAFDWASLARLAALTSRLRLAGVISEDQVARAGGIEGAVARLTDTVRATDLGVEHTVLSQETARVVHAAGLALGAWTPSTPDALRAAIDRGVDWLITDRADLALALRAVA
jgi:glycerophosphoryl diester phosphodiesterase